MEINPQYNKPVIGSFNKMDDVVSVEKEEQQREQILSVTDKNASSAISAMGKSLVSRSFMPAQTLEELQQQVKNTTWIENRDDIDLLSNVFAVTLPTEYISRISEVLHKANGLIPELKESFSIENFIQECYTCSKNNKKSWSYLENLKNFSPELYNKLDTDMLEKTMFPLEYSISQNPLQNVDEVNECYRTAKDGDKKTVTGLLYCDFGKSSRILKLLKVIDETDPEIVHIAKSREILNSSLDTSTLIDTLAHLSEIKKQGTRLLGIYVQDLLKKDYSYSLANRKNEPVCGTDMFKPFTSKEQLKTELASTRSSAGKLIFSNDDIDFIINNENDIGELSKILNEIKSNKIELSSNVLLGILKREGVTLDIVKPLIDLYSQIQSSDEYENVRTIVSQHACDFFKLKKDEVEAFKKNLPFVAILQEKFPDEFVPNDFWDNSILFRILVNSKMSPDVFEQIINQNIYDEDIDCLVIQDLLKKDDVKPENIKFVHDLKNSPQLQFLFDEELGFGRLNKYNIDSLLNKNLPENIDLTQKTDIIDFLRGVMQTPDKDIISARGCVNVLLKETDDNIEDCRNIVSFLTDNGITGDDYFTKHSFSDTWRLLNDFYLNPLLNGHYSSITSHNVDFLDDFVEVADYAAKLSAFKGAELEFTKIFSSYSGIDCEIKMNTEKIKADLTYLDELSHKMSPKLWGLVQSTLLSSVMASNFKINEENISYFDELVNDERFEGYINWETEDVEKLLSKDVNIETLRANKDDFLSFMEQYPKHGIVNIDKESFITFEGDFKKLASKVEQIKQHYPDSPISVELLKNGINVQVGEHVELLFDKNLNFISRTRAHCFEKEDGSTYTGVLSTDKELGIKNYVVYVKDPVYDDATIEKLTSRYIGDDGEIVNTKVYKASSIDGVYDIKEIAPNGDVKIVSSSEQTERGEKIEKHLTSPNGVTTDVLYQSNNGDEEYSYVIKASNGDILTALTRTSENIDANTKITTVNGKKYKVEYSDDKIDVYDFSTEQTTGIDLAQINPDKDPTIQDLLRSLSGDELIKTVEFVNKIEIRQRIESAIDPVNKVMYVGPHKFIFEHELGHGKDSMTVDTEAVKNGDLSSLEISKIASDKTLIEIFEKEKCLAKKSLPECVLKEIDYFIADGEDHYGGESGGLKEVIAETNAIQNSTKFHPFLKMRTQILQEYFPETISYLLNNHLN